MMDSKAILTLIVLLVVIILYATEKLPLALTAMLSMLAMYFTGVLSFEDAFSGFSNNAFIMVLGMSIFGSAFAGTGLVEKLAGKLEHLFTKKDVSERTFILLGGCISAVMSMFLNPMLVTTIFMNIIDTIAPKSNGKITRRGTTFPISVASAYGSMFTSVSATTIILTSSLMEESEIGRPLNFFEPAVIGIPCFLVFLIFYATIGCPLQKKVYHFKETDSEIEAITRSEVKEYSTKKQVLTLIILAVCIALFIFSDFSLGAVAFGGAAALFLTGCVDLGYAFKTINWSTAILVASSIGFAKGVDVSGAGAIIARTLIRVAGPILSTPVGVCLLGFVLSSLLSNFMSNSSTALILVPLFISIARETGTPLVPAVLASGVGAGMATATPICTAHIILTTAVGYRFKDYVKIGGLLNILAIAAATIALKVFYF